MSPTQALLLIAALIAASAFFSISEISLAAARRLRLRQMADEGELRAAQVLALQEHPGRYITVVQIGLNAVAILAGIVGEGALTPHLASMLGVVMSEEPAQRWGFALSFLIITSVFILFADLFPKRLGMSNPEALALRVVGPMRVLMTVLAPLVWVFDRAASVLFRLLGLRSTRDDRITHDDILAMAEAGTESGLLAQQEQQVIANVFELETRTVESAMTPRERIDYLLQDADEAVIRARIAQHPRSTYLVCERHIDGVIGYVDATDLFQRMLNGQPISLHGEGLVKKVLMVPDRLTLSEVLTHFRQRAEDFAVIVNEYSLVVGIITLNDVMSTVMGSLVGPGEDEQMIVQRDADSWLIDGVAPVPDVLRALELDELPHRGQYDTLAGFLMVMLRRIPRRTDKVVHAGYQFEVVDVDSFRVDQVLVTRLAGAAPARDR
ncbi:MAG TPA: hemolysin family protein [Burkholderiaceae bacterium]|jgi:CBS domain containing-hemolysin-like protein|nr:hemolysin family protein [Burkholderiaceae bacterium]